MLDISSVICLVLAFLDWFENSFLVIVVGGRRRGESQESVGTSLAVCRMDSAFDAAAALGRE
jgi:hypothetical protein